MDEIKIDEVLEFCERVLCKVPLLRKEWSLDQQQRLHEFSSPRAFRTTEKRLSNTSNLFIFSILEGNSEDKTHLVALTGIEPVSQP
jgi:hypothetical protein